MRRKLPLLEVAACILLISQVALAITTDGAVAVSVLDPEPGQTLIRYDFSTFQSETLNIEGVEYQSVTLADEANTFEKGFPSLPMVTRSVIIPEDSRVTLQVVESDYREIENVRIMPSKGVIKRTVNPETVPYTFDEFYTKDAWYPEKIADTREPYILRDVRGMVVIINPFQYNPARNLLRVYESVTVRISASGPGITNVLRSDMARESRSFNLLHKTHFINFPEDRYGSLDEEGDLLIITYDSFNSNIQDLATWKNSRGIATTVVDVSVVGNSSSAIQDYIQDYYDGNNLAFVLLVGDASQVATPKNQNSAADPTYALVAGGDSYPDIFVGRFSATSTGQVDTQVERTMEYEGGVHAGDWSWKGVGIASNQGPGHNGEYDDEHMDLIRDDLLAFGYTEVDQIYDPSASKSMVSTAVNSGRAMINYCGHGSTTSWGTTGFSNSDVNNLTNNNMLPFITTVACLNGNFENSTCFAEAWLQATNGSEPTGAVGMYASSINQAWDQPMEAQDEFADRFCDGTYDTFGALCFAASCKMIDRYGSSGIDEFNHWHIFGDPSLNVRGDGSSNPTFVDIKANGEDGPLNVSPGTTITLTASVNPGELEGVTHDWWLMARRNEETKYWWTISGEWIQSAAPVRAYEGALLEIDSFEITSGSIPSGTWGFTFAVDEQNGSYEGTYKDHLRIVAE